MENTVRQRLTDCMIAGSKADKALASYMLAKLSSIPFETAATLAAKVTLSEPTVGRFCRSIGYKSFKDLKEQLRRDIGDRPWLISDRLREFQQRTLAGADQLAKSLQLEMAGARRGLRTGSDRRMEENRPAAGKNQNGLRHRIPD